MKDNLNANVDTILWWINELQKKDKYIERLEEIKNAEFVKQLLTGQFDPEKHLIEIVGNEFKIKYDSIKFNVSHTDDGYYRVIISFFWGKTKIFEQEPHLWGAHPTSTLVIADLEGKIKLKVS